MIMRPVCAKIMCKVWGNLLFQLRLLLPYRDTSHMFMLQCTLCMHIGGNCSWNESDCNEEVWNESDEEVWNEDFDTDLENGSDDTSDIPEVIQAGATPQSALAKWLLVFILYLQSIFHLSDSVVGYLIKFMKTFFGVVGRFCTACAEIAAVFPSSLYRARKACHIDDLKFKRYVVCRKCHRLYFLKDCISGTGIA